MAGGTVTLRPTLGPAVTLLLMGPPDRSGGVGGWVGADRAGRTPGKWWQSIPDSGMSLECALDVDELPGIALEGRVVQLKAMGLPRPDNDNEPPPLQVSGDVQADDRARWWVLQDLKWGERLFITGGGGLLRRQAVTVDLELWTPIEEVSAARITRTRRAGRKRRRHVVHALVNDTLRTIALRELGNGSRWDDIRKWNPKLRKTDPDLHLRRGTHVVIR